MHGTAVDALMKYVGRRALAVNSGYARVMASVAASRGIKCSRYTAFIEVDALPRLEGCENLARRSHETINGSITLKGPG